MNERHEIITECNAVPMQEKDWQEVAVNMLRYAQERYRAMVEAADKETNPMKFIEKRAIMVALNDIIDFYYNMLERA